MAMDLDEQMINQALETLKDPVGREIIEEIEKVGVEIFEDIENDPAIESELLTDLSHFSSDIITFFGIGTLGLRFFNVVGRVFGLAGDYVYDKTVRLDELYFQLTMLFISSMLLGRSLRPKMNSIFANIGDKDRMAFELLFGPCGVTENQFKGLVACGALEWVELGPNVSFVGEGKDENADFLYWLYSGDVEVCYDGVPISIIKRSTGKSIDDPQSVGLFGDMQFLYALDRRNKENRGPKNKSGQANVNSRLKTNETSHIYGDYPAATMTTSSKTSLLKINCAKLFQLMDDDESLALSIRDLLIKGLQRKVAYLLVIVADTSRKDNLSADR